MSLKPRALEPGARLAVVAPASAFERAEFDRGVDEIRRLGFEPVYDDSVFEKQRYLAGSAAIRARAIEQAWRDPAVAGLIAVRGGYGSAQVLPLLDRDAARRARKPFIGCSDLTAVLTVLTTSCDLVAFHGPMLAGRSSLGEAGYDRASFLAALTRREPMGELQAPAARDAAAGRSGRRAARRNAHAAAGLAGDAVRLCPAGRPRALSRRGRRAAVPAGPHGDAAAADGPARARGGGRHRRAPAVRRAGRRPDGPRRDGRPVRRFSRAGPDRVSRPATPRARPSPFRSACRAAWSAAAGRAWSSKNRRWSSRVTDLSDRHLRYGHGHACRDAQAEGPRRARLRSGRLSSDERFSRGGRHCGHERLPRGAHHERHRFRGGGECGVAREPRARGSPRPQDPVRLAARSHPRPLPVGCALHRDRRDARQDDDHVADRLGAHERRHGSQRAGRRGGEEFRRARFELSAGRRPRLRHRGRRVRQRVLRQDGQVPEVHPRYRGRQQRGVRSRGHLRGFRGGGAGVPAARQSRPAPRPAAGRAPTTRARAR